MNSWEKIGLLYQGNTNANHPKLRSHQSNPLPILIKDDIFRIFFNSRDSKQRSSIGAVDIDISQQKVINEFKTPFFEHGSKNSFFSDGISIGNSYESNGKKYMLFMGWRNPKNDHWRGEIGRLIIKPNLTLELDSEKPFLSIDHTDPISLSYPYVIQKPDGTFYMWYGSTKSWGDKKNSMIHLINYAISSDGHNWTRKGLALPYQLNVAQAFSKPCVILNSDDSNFNYEMWYSFRGTNQQKYRIGYATSTDGEKWEHNDHYSSGISTSKEGWDSEMIEYPYVFDHKGQRYMIYNGNNYGKSGFGLAIQNKK